LQAYRPGGPGVRQTQFAREDPAQQGSDRMARKSSVPKYRLHKSSGERAHYRWTGAYKLQPVAGSIAVETIIQVFFLLLFPRLAHDHAARSNS